MARRLTGASFCTAGATVTGTGAESFVRSAAPPPHEQVERRPRPARRGASMRGGRAGLISVESIFAPARYRHAARRATCMPTIPVDNGARGSHLSLARRRGLTAMQQATNARAFLRRLHPWIGKAVHGRWTHRRSFYQSEVDALLLALGTKRGAIPPELRLRLEGFLGRLYREWFPRTWRREPTYAEIVTDFRWWIGVAERWSEPPAKTQRRRVASTEPLADQPPRLLRLLGLTRGCTESEFTSTWRRFLKRHH